MSELVVIGFDDAFKAFELRVALMKMQAEFGIAMEDAAVVARDPDGRITLDQAIGLNDAGAAGGSFWGLLTPALLLLPRPEALADIGVDERFAEELAASLTPGSSALLVLVRTAAPHGVLAGLQGVGGRIMRTALTRDGEQGLRRALSGSASEDRIGQENLPPRTREGR